MTQKIYTRTGDKGKTSLIGGTKVPKSHIRIESYGTIDELNSFIGLLSDQVAALPIKTLPDSHFGNSLTMTVSDLLKEIQDRLFTIGASLACDPGKDARMKIPDLKEEDIGLLERMIDFMSEELPPMKSFILPGGHVALSTAHIARCVCRRAERLCVGMQESDLYIEPLVIKYLNRLSDYLFVLARWLGFLMHIPEIPWKPRT
ncbi:MAG: cob(I)yrinic acid a,c-diamide adenosyltransferase [Puia sp.]|nr:cob(I)yrinic acid a,c-diamide adenosyltransferase [Puia sp.]